MSIDPMVALALRLAYALLFCGAAAHKLRDLTAFRRALAAYEVLPAWAIPAGSTAVVVAETMIGAGLATSMWAETAAAAGIALLGLYAGGIAVNLSRGRRAIVCGCGGFGGERPITRALAVRNALLISGLALVLLPAAPRPLGWVDWASAGFAVVASVLLYAAADVALANAARLFPAGATR